MALPTQRRVIAQPGSPDKGPTYGHYFRAIQAYLQGDGWPVLTETASRILNRPVTSTNIQGLDIHLVKHGALYHPSLVTVQVDNDLVRLALNVATSVEGRRVLQREYDLLQRLNRDYPASFIPLVYGCGQGLPGDGQPAMEMFLAQWFDGYYEFHISDTKKTGRHWRIWDDDHGHRSLTPRQIEDVFRQAAQILTYYLNPVSLESVLDWHHAAGDFILRTTPHSVQVRLISIRRYAPFLQRQQQRSPAVEALLEALTLFLLRTSLWLRLDRLDGVGELVWADNLVLEPIWQGFGHGLNAMVQACDLPVELATGAMAYVAAHSDREMVATGSRMVDQWIIPEPERALIRRQLSSHIDALMDIVRAGHPDTASNALMSP